LVDSIYAPVGNPEHQPNGLMLNIDNWIYNAKSQFRYRRKKGVWEKETTAFRGQWGITHDNFGRLYYNDNIKQLMGDFVLPNQLIRNRYHEPTVGLNHIITPDQRVYPLSHSAVNRGYIEGVLDKDSLLVNVTAACGPQIYRGDQFPDEYQENAFVCAPEANLVKRNILTFYGDSVNAKQAIEGEDFLASTDEGFRPVNISNGPDGNLYIVDMHRGVIGHYAYLSPYLKEQIRLKQLDSMVNMGRILRVSHSSNNFSQIPDLNTLSEKELIEMLGHNNGWLRDRAQHFIVYKNLTNTRKNLEQLALDIKNPIAQIHALYALQGTDQLNADLLINVAEISNAELVAHAVTLLNEFISMDQAPGIQRLFKALLQKNEIDIDLYITFSIGGWIALSEDLFFPIAMEMASKYNQNPLFEEAFISGLADNADQYLLAYQQSISTNNDGLSKKLAQTIENKNSNTINPLFADAVLPLDNRTKGAQLFNTICAACHGPGGRGIDGLAPPLMNSEYISQSNKRLGLIILHGIKGPVTVQGKLYDNLHPMPGFINNEAMTDQDIADIISYVTNAFSDAPKNMTLEEIKTLRELRPESGVEYTEAELMEIPIDENKAINIR
jgi:mono/diheme cytochrome c family protein